MTCEQDVFGVVFDFMDADLRRFQGGIEAQVITAGKKPVADCAIYPAADAANDLADADRAHAKQFGDFNLFDAAHDNEAVNIEVSRRRDFGIGGHDRSLEICADGGHPQQFVG